MFAAPLMTYPGNARQGTPASFSADPLTRTRIEWLKEFLLQHVGAEKASTSSIVRLAIDHYVTHAEALLRLPKGAEPLKQEWRSFMCVNRGSQNELAPEVIAEAPLRTLRELFREQHAAERAKPIPHAGRDPDYWERLANED